ncbi:MAG: HAD family hydrolase [Bacteroidota bacterium]
MKEHKKNLSVNKDWSLFLDRDGVINKRIPGEYIKRWEEFEILPGTLEAISRFSELFGKIFVVTNQQGIGKGQMTENDLLIIHDQMLNSVTNAGGKIDKIYHCPDLEKSGSFCRKPQIGMALKAKKDYPSVNLKYAVMAGDSASDMKFGRDAGMITVLIGDDLSIAREHPDLVDFHFDDLRALSLAL